MAKKEDTYQKLKHLKMKDELIDDYITTFNSLAAKAGWELSNKGMINTFHSGLHPRTLNARWVTRGIWEPETSGSITLDNVDKEKDPPPVTQMQWT
jgi:Retrotransposon gag protein